MLKIIIYDCEVINCIPSQKERLNRRFSYCQGWSDFGNMGISVIGFQLLGCEGFTDGMYSIVNRENVIPFAGDYFADILAKKPLVIGFNSRRFDDALLKANNMVINTDYDLLEEIRLTSYGSSRWHEQPKGWNYSLGSIARANGMGKTGSGNFAPQLWQQGKRQEVIDYCLNDVWLTTEILRLGQEGKLIDPNTGKYLKLKKIEALSS